MSRSRFRFSNIGGGMFREGYGADDDEVDNDKLYNTLGIGKQSRLCNYNK